MAFPGTPAITGYSSGTSNATSWAAFSNVSVPSGSLAVFIVASDGNPTLSVGGADTDWEILSQLGQGTSVRGAVFYWFNDTGSAVNKSFTLSSSGSEQFSGLLVLIPRATAGYAMGISGTFAGQASSANPNPPSHDAGTSRDHFWIAAVASDSTGLPSAVPTNYSNGTNQQAPGTGSASVFYAQRTLTAQTEDPGTFTHGTSRARVNMTLAVWEEAPPGPPEGTLVKTLDTLSSSSTGKVLITGADSPEKTLGVLTLTGTTKLIIQGSLTGGAILLGSLTGSSTGSVRTAGSLVQSLGAVALSAASGVRLTGALNQGLGALGITGGSVLRIKASTTQTLGSLVANSSGDLEGSGPVTGTLAGTLGAITVTIGGSLPITGSTDYYPIGGAGRLLLTGQGNITFASLGGTSEALHTVLDPILGEFNVTLGLLGASGDADINIQGATSNGMLGGLVFSGTGSIRNTGSFAQTLGAATTNAGSNLRLQGTLTQGLGTLLATGSGNSVIAAGAPAGNLGSIIVAATASIGIVGHLTATLNPVELSAAGSVDSELPLIVGNLVTELGTLVVGADAALPIEGTTPTQPGGAGRVLLSAVGNVQLGSLTGIADGIFSSLPELSGALSVSLGELTVSAFGYPIPIGTVGLLTGNLDDLMGVGTGNLHVTGAVLTELGALQGSFTGAVRLQAFSSLALGELLGTSDADTVQPTISGTVNASLADLTIVASGRESFSGDGVGFGSITLGHASSYIVGNLKDALIDTGLRITPIELFFGMMTPDEDQIVREFTVTNVGRRSLNLTQPQIQSEFEFEIIGETPDILRPGEAFTLGVRYLTSAPGIFTGLVLIQTNEDRGPYIVKLSGRIIGYSYIEALWNDLSALVSEEAWARATADEAEAGARLALQAQLLDQISASVLVEQNARVSAIDAEASQRLLLETNFIGEIGTVNARISDETIAWTNAVSAEAVQRENLRTEMLFEFANLPDYSAEIAIERAARISEDGVTATTFSKLGALSPDGTAFVLNESTVMVNTTTSLAQLRNTIESQGTEISTVATALTDLDGSVGTLTTRLNARAINLIPNPNFADGLDDWLVSTGAWAKANSPTHGSYARVLGNGRLLSESLPTLVGTELTLSTNLAFFSDAGTFGIRINWLNNLGVIIASTSWAYKPRNTDFSSSVLDRVRITATAPANTEFVQIEVLAAGLSGPSFAAIKEVKLEANGEMSPYSDEASFEQLFLVSATQEETIASMQTTLETQGAAIDILAETVTGGDGSAATLITTVAAHGVRLNDLDTLTATQGGQITQEISVRENADGVLAQSILDTQVEIETNTGLAITAAVGAETAARVSAIASEATARNVLASRFEARVGLIPDIEETWGAYGTTADVENTWDFDSNAFELAADDGSSGGKNLALTAATANNVLSLLRSLPFDREGTYRLTVQLLTLPGNTGNVSAYAGAIPQTYNDLDINPTDAGSFSYFAGSGEVLPPGTLTTLVGYASGTTPVGVGNGVGLPSVTIEDPSPMPTGTVKVKPLLLLYDMAVGDIVLVRSIKWERVDVIRTTNARITNEETTRSSAVSALAERATTLEATVNTGPNNNASLSGRITTEEGVRASEDGVLAGLISDVSTSVGDLTTTVSTQQVSINGISARYAVTIDANGNVSGYELIGGGGGSEFNVRADSFKVFNPATSLTEPVLEATGGVVRIRNAVIGDANIATGNVQPGAISNSLSIMAVVPVVGVVAPGNSLNGASVSIALTNGGPVRIDYSLGIVVTNTDNGGYVLRRQLTRQIGAGAIELIDETPFIDNSAFYLDSPPAGISVTYRLRATNTAAASPTIELRDQRIILTEFKR